MKGSLGVQGCLKRMNISQCCILSAQDCSLMSELLICRNSCEDAEARLRLPAGVGKWLWFSYTVSHR